MNRARRPPLLHPLAPVFDRAVDSLSAALSPDTTSLPWDDSHGADHRELNRLHQLRREPHLLGWMSRLRSQAPPLATAPLYQPAHRSALHLQRARLDRTAS